MTGNPPYVYNIYTDIDRLHKVVMSDNHERGAGVTFAICHTLAGVMATDEQSGVHCRVVSFDRVAHIMNILTRRVFPDHCIEYDRAIHRNSYSFNIPGGTRKRINFILLDDEAALMGSRWPVVDFREGPKSDYCDANTLDSMFTKFVNYEVGEDGEL